MDRRFRGILDCCNAVDQIVERPKNAWNVRKLGQFDYALDMQGLFKSGVLVGLARANNKLGYHWQREGAGLFSRAVIPDPSSIHVVDQYIDVARTLGVAECGTAFCLAPIAEDVVKVQNILKSKGLLSDRFVLCNAGAGWVTKRWNPNKYSDLTKRLSQVGYQCVFLGALSDRVAYDEVMSHGAVDTVNMVGETNVRELVALVSLATLHIAGDTGSTHIAAALGKPAIGIYTQTRLERSCPYGQIADCFQGDPCADDVLKVAIQLLEKEGSGGQSAR